MSKENYFNCGCSTCMFAERDERGRYLGSCSGFSNCSYEEYKGKTDITEEEKDKQIADLEAKLAESEKDRLMWQEMYKSADRQNKSICETDIYPLQEENQQLKDKLEIKLEELHIAYCSIENVKTKNGNLKGEVNQLKQQLAEKEKLIEFYINSGKEQCEEINKLNHRALNYCDAIDKANQDKISFAIAELEKVERTFIDIAWQDADFAIEIIDDQIAELKKERKKGETNGI